MNAHEGGRNATDRLRLVRWGSLTAAVAMTVHVFFTARRDTPQAQQFMLALLAWNLVPLLPPLLWPLARRPLLATAWMVGCAMADAYAYWAVVMHPTSSTSALLYLFLPAYELVGVGPLSIGVAFVAARFARRAKRSAGQAFTEPPPPPGQ